MNSEEFERLYKSHHLVIEKTFTLWVTHPTQTLITELTQETWARCFANQNSSIKNPHAWVLGIARRVFLEYLREKKRDSQSIEIKPEHLVRNLEYELQRKAKVAFILNILRQHMNDRYIQVLIWHHCEGLKDVEIAALLNIKHKNVRLIKHRATGSARSILRRHGLLSLK